MTTAVLARTLNPDQSALLEKVLLSGDLAPLEPHERLAYYRAVCESVGLNPYTRPFEYVRFDGKLQFYARKNCAEQLREIHEVTLTDTRVESIDGLYVAHATATLPSGRTDSDIGVVNAPVNPADRPNAMMKSLTKAKRRVTFSICGLSVLDEDDLSDPRAQAVEVDDQGRIQKIAAPSAVPAAQQVEPAEERQRLLDRIADLQTTCKRNDPKGFDPKVYWNTHVGSYFQHEAPIELLNDLVRVLTAQEERTRKGGGK